MHTVLFSCCLSNAIHGIGQILKSLECMSVCLCVCVRTNLSSTIATAILQRSAIKEPILQFYLLLLQLCGSEVINWEPMQKNPQCKGEISHTFKTAKIFVRSSSNLVHGSHTWKRPLSSVDKFPGSMAPLLDPQNRFWERTSSLSQWRAFQRLSWGLIKLSSQNSARISNKLNFTKNVKSGYKRGVA